MTSGENIALYVTFALLAVTMILFVRSLLVTINVSRQRRLTCAFCLQESEWGVRVCRYCHAAVHYHQRYLTAIAAAVAGVLAGLLVDAMVWKENRIFHVAPLFLGVAGLGMILAGSRPPWFSRRG
jgi:hypothetical protein